MAADDLTRPLGFDRESPAAARRRVPVGKIAGGFSLALLTGLFGFIAFARDPLGGKDIAAAIDALARNKYDLRKRVAAALTLKYAPDLRFRADDTFAAMDETRRLFANPTVQRDIAARDDEDESDI